MKITYIKLKQKDNINPINAIRNDTCARKMLMVVAVSRKTPIYINARRSPCFFVFVLVAFAYTCVLLMIMNMVTSD